jgi:hypothetical protein
MAYGLRPVTSFAQITSDVKVQQELQQAYGSVDNIDPFVGGLAEDHVPGSDLGPTFQAILVNQFTRLETGDRYFYLNESFSSAEAKIMDQGSTLGQIIENNTDVTNLQPDVFKFTASISGTVSFAQNGNNQGGNGDGGNGVAGITVQLQDANGNVVATTVTNQHGNYTFTQQSGPAANPTIASGVSHTGDYQVVLVLPQNLQQVGPHPGTIDITRGGLNVTGVNFSVTFDSDSSSSSSGSSSATPAAANTPTAASPSSAAVTTSSSATPAVSSVDTTQTATTTSIAMALSNSTGSGTAATPQASTPAGQAPGTGSTSIASNQSTAVFVAKLLKAARSTDPLSGAAGGDQTVSG